MKRLFRWALYLLVIAVALAVAGVLLLDTMVKELAQSRLRAETGMDVKIGKMDIGLLTPTISIEGFRMYNTPEFGGSPFLDIPEIFVEYDREAIRAGKLHLRLVRVSIAEIDIMQDKKGRLNIQGVEEKGKAAQEAALRQPPGLEFAGIDTLNLSFQKLRLSNLEAPGRAEEINFHLTNQVFPNIKSQGDLEGMAVVLAGRSGAASGGGKAPIDLQKLLRELLH